MESTREEKYIFSIDPYPQESEDQNKLYKFYDYLREGRLATTRCLYCKTIKWPPRTVCPQCMSDELEWVDIPTPGKIYAYTVAMGAIPSGFEPPLVYALVDFDNGLRMLTPLVDTRPEEVREGALVELEVLKVNRDRVLPGFRLKKS